MTRTARSAAPGWLAHVVPLLALVAIMWAVAAGNALLGGGLNRYGIEPRTWSGLAGIPLAPFLHSGFAHLASNSVPLLVLGGMVCLRGRSQFWLCTGLVVVLGGVGVWLLGRAAHHVGASGLVYGFFGYLVALGWFERRAGSVAIAVVTVALYSGVIWGVVPSGGRTSWEAHLFGLLAGVLAARLIARRAARRGDLVARGSRATRRRERPARRRW